MTINRNEITKEMLAQAMQCKTVGQLMELAKTKGFDISKEEAKAYMAEMADVELDNEQLEKVAGGDGCYLDCKIDRCPGFDD